jgi:hypothetical protein
MIADLRLDKSPSWRVSIFGQTLSHKTLFAAALKLLKGHVLSADRNSRFDLDFMAEGSYCQLRFRKGWLYEILMGDPG